MPTTKLYHPRPNIDLRPQSRVAPSKSNFTSAACRQMAMYDSRKPGANFKCPGCRTYFYLTYGRFGTMGASFESPTYHCRDCAKSSKFVAA